MNVQSPFVPAPVPVPASAPLPPTAPTAAASVDGQPLAQRPKSFFAGRFGLIFGLVVIILSVLAVVLASGGPFLVNHAVVPAGMNKVYDGVPTNSTAWSIDKGCLQVANGLDVSSDARNGCQFLPSENADLLSQGFYLSVTLAPDASVTNAQLPVVAFGNDVFVTFDSSGAYLICTGNCDAFGGDTRVSAFSTAWHTDGYTPNTISVVYQPGADNGQNALVLFVNGQQTRTVDLSVPGGSDLVLAATEPAQGQAGEAIYTHVTLYSAASQGS